MDTFQTRLDSYITDVVIPSSSEFDQGRTLAVSDAKTVFDYQLLLEILSPLDRVSVVALSRAIVKVSSHCGNLRNLFLVNFGMVGRLLVAVSPESDFFTKVLKSLSRGKIIGSLAITEESGGSNPSANLTTVSNSGGVARLNGKKVWITLGAVADFYLVQVKVEGVSRFVFVPRDAPGVSVAPLGDMMGCRGSGLAKITFENVLIRDEFFLPKCMILSGGCDPCDYVMRNGRLFAGAAGLGMGLSALSNATRALHAKKNFKGALLFQGDWQSKLAELYLRSVMIRETLLRIMSEYPSMISSADDHFSPLKILGTQFALDCANINMKASGASAYQENSFANRNFREAISGEYIEGSNSVLTLRCSQEWLSKVFAGQIYAPF